MLSVKTILYVEDDLASQTLYQKRLEREGFHVECARDGQAALDMLAERAPDLVLLDLMLPKVSGANVLKFMHADPRLTTIPVIIFSNAPMTEVPSDEPSAHGTRRLLKCDCPFPMLLSTIQEMLAQAPEFVVMEAGKMGPLPSLAANGDSQRFGVATATLRYPDTETAFFRGRSEFLKEAATMMSKIRKHSMGYIKAADSAAGRAHLSGLHQLVRLLDSSASQAGCPRVALLTNAFDALLCGIMDKPATVTPSTLQTVAQAVDCLDGLLNSKNDDGYSSGPSFQAKVLVVDDDPVCNHVNVNSLKRAHFNAVGVKDPTAALSMLESTPFNLVVLDINMPGMTGFDVCEKLRRLPHCQKIPVIFVTAFSNFDNRKQSVLSGGNDFVSKPVSPLELALKVTVNLIKARTSGVNADDLPMENQVGLNHNAAADISPPASSLRMNRAAAGETQPTEPPARPTSEVEATRKEDNRAAPLRMVRPESESRPLSAPQPELESKTQMPTTQPSNGTTQDTKLHERLRQSSAALKRARAGLERESAERAQLESRWREQLSTAETLVQHTETVLKEKKARCNQLEQELGELRKTRDELQNKFAAVQQTTAKTQQELKELKTNLEKQSAERTRLETEWRGQLDAAKAATAQKETALQEKEIRCGQLQKELAGLQQIRDELQSKVAGEQQMTARAQQETREVRANLEKLSVERSRLEAESREQLKALKEVAGRTETALKEKETRCAQLERETVGLQHARDEFQNKLVAEQQTAAKSQQTVNDLQKRLRQGNEELERVNAELKKQSAAGKHLEAELREQLNTAKAAAGQTEARLAEKTSRCHRLETEVAGLQQTHDEIQNRLATETQKAARSQQEIKQLQELLQQSRAELEHARAACEQESAKRTHLESECKNLTQAKETINLELNNLRERRTALEAKLRDKQRKLAGSLRENIQLLQSRLQEVESFNGDAEEVSKVELQLR